jgi:hypothetical protein
LKKKEKFEKGGAKECTNDKGNTTNRLNNKKETDK